MRAGRSLWVVVVAVAAIGGGGCASGVSPTGRLAARGAPAPVGCPTATRRLGLIAFAAQGRLELVDLARCQVAVLRRTGAGEPRFSPNGRWLAFGRRGGGRAPFPVVIPSHGGRERAPLGTAVEAWSWAPRGELLYGITDAGQLLAAAPGGARRVVAAGLGTESDAHGTPMRISPAGDAIAVDRSRCGPALPTGELDVVDVRTGARTVAIRRSGEFFTFAGWSADGHWLLFWVASECSGSLDADGWPLYAVPAAGGRQVEAVPHMLLFDDFLSWCGSRLIAAAGPDRETNIASRLVEVTPPAWGRRTLEPARSLSWVSPACAVSGRILAAAAGPNHAPGQFGLENRSIWLLRGRGGVVHRLTLPPAADVSDEAPRFSRDGRWILFVRTRVVPVDSSRDTIELVRAIGGAPVPIVDFASDDFSFYDHFGWPYEIAWSQSG